MGELLQTLGSGGAVYYGRLAGIWVMVMHRPPGEADMLLARPTLKQMTQSDPQGFPTLTWILPSAGYSLDAPSRKAASSITSEFVSHIKARATLIDGTGFQAAAVRAIVVGIDVVSRTSSPGKVFSDLGSSVAWSLALVPRPTAGPAAPAPTAASLAQALNEEVARLLAS